MTPRLPLALLGAIVLLSAVTGSLAATGSLASCRDVASRFRNTCSSQTAASSVSALTGATVTCNNMDQVSCPGTLLSNPSRCQWTRKLCVTCRTDASNNVLIRVQSNSLPDHCIKAPVAPVSTDIDFEVQFDRSVTLNPQGWPNARDGFTWPTSQAEVTGLLCGDPGQLSSSSPSAASLAGLTFYPNNVDQLQGATGVGINGVVLLNQMSADRVDPYYPRAWGGSSHTTAEMTDICMGHPQGTNMYHYHIMSSCWFNSTNAGTPIACGDSPVCSSSYKDWAMNSVSGQTRLTVFGLSKDGRVIYGPYYQGARVQNLDVCNGRLIDSDGNGSKDRYAYFATDTFPYFQGCFGPGNWPAYRAECSSNNPTAYVRPY